LSGGSRHLGERAFRQADGGARTVTDERRRFVLFVLAGGTAAVVNILSRIALNWVMPYEAAIVAAYLCGMTTAYLLNRHFVFAASGLAVASEDLRFAL